MIATPPSNLRPGPSALSSNERGAALVVGLILMLALTVLGISGMNMAALELTMANNTQAQQRAFERAETGIDRAIARALGTAGPEHIRDDLDGDGRPDINVTTQPAGQTLVPDGEGWSTDVIANHFDTVSVGRGPRNAVSVHNQSFYVIGPKPSNVAP